MTNSHILVHQFDYFEPRTLEQAVSLLDEYGDQARVLAGGTYLIIQMKMERQAPRYLINTGHLAPLTRSHWQDDALKVGAGNTIYAVRGMSDIQQTFTALAESCAAFGSTQIQLMGTLGGNLCNGSPASDTVPALIALDARLRLVGTEGERVVSVEDFVLGPGRTDRRPGELLVSVSLPRWQPGTGSAFVKVSRVAADLAKASGAAVIVRDGDRIVDCRLAFGSVGPRVLRVRQAEELLKGQAFDSELALEAGRRVSEEITPIDDVRSSAEYRRQVVKAITHDVLRLAWDRAGRADSESKVGAEASAQPGPTPSPSPETEGPLRVRSTERHAIELTVNGEKHRLWVAPNELLLNVLRERLQLTGSKYGCGIGECGACTVHLDGKPALSCLILAVSADGSDVLTVEGLQGPDGELDPLQDAFIEQAAFQCGYCTPGMLMMSKSLLKENVAATEDDVRDYLKGNRCRCTGFTSIVRAVMSCTNGSTAD
jgi:carbon-monoxide dehydrogenase medium subunit